MVSWLSRAGLVILSYLALAAASSLFRVTAAPAWLFWLPSGLTLALLLRSDAARWPLQLASIFAAEILYARVNGYPLSVAIAFAGCDTVEPLVGALLIRRVAGPYFDLTRFGDVVLMGAVAVATPLLPAALAAAGAVRWLAAPSWWDATLSWWFADSVGILILTPFLLTWSATHRLSAPRRSAFELALLMTALAVVLEVTFALRAAAPGARLIGAVYLVFGLLLRSATRFDFRGVAAMMLLGSFLAGYHMVREVSPFAPPATSLEGLMVLQANLSFVALASLVLAAALYEHRVREGAQRLLSRVSAALAETTTTGIEGGGDHLARLLLSLPADACTIDVEIEGSLRRIGRAHVDPAQASLLDGPSTELPGGAAGVSAQGSRTVLVAPILSDGRSIGAITIASRVDGVRYGRADVDLVDEVARRAAVAIENARLYRLAQEGMIARDAFLAVASHELKTPLMPLTLSLQSILRGARARPGEVPQAIVHRVEMAERQTHRLARIADSILDASRAEVGRIELERGEVDLVELVREQVAALDREIAPGGYRLILPPGEEALGFWDRRRIGQVVGSLLANAAKFGAGKGIEIRVAVEGDRVRLSVQDHGVGIARDAQATVFERGAWAAAVKPRGGLGLGLYLSRKIVEAHGGSIAVESEIGHGATFVVDLPARASAGAALSRGAQATSA